MRNIKKISGILFSVVVFVCLLVWLTGCTKQSTKQRLITDFQEIISPDTKPEIVIDGTREETLLVATEGPTWMNGKLYFSNYTYPDSSKNEGIWVVNPDKSYKILNKVVKTIGTTPLPNGNLAACFFQMPTKTQPLKTGVVEITPGGELVRSLADSYNDIPLGAPNDLITDKKGGLYFTDPWGGKLGNKQPGTAVYYLNPQGKLIRVTEWNDLGFPNGCEISQDGSKFYLDDAMSTTVQVYDVNDDGTLSNKRVFAELRVNESLVEKEKPWIGGDGMTIDREGNLYVATFLDPGIQVFNKNGEFLGNIKFPTTPSNCIFGGKNMSTLYVTCHKQQVYSIQTKMKGFQFPMR